MRHILQRSDALTLTNVAVAGFVFETFGSGLSPGGFFYVAYFLRRGVHRSLLGGEGGVRKFNNHNLGVAKVHGRGKYWRRSNAISVMLSFLKAVLREAAWSRRY